MERSSNFFILSFFHSFSVPSFLFFPPQFCSVSVKHRYFLPIPILPILPQTRQIRSATQPAGPASVFSPFYHLSAVQTRQGRHHGPSAPLKPRLARPPARGILGPIAQCATNRGNTAPGYWIHAGGSTATADPQSHHITSHHAHLHLKEKMVKGIVFVAVMALCSAILPLSA
jgi:hypothetical protein